MRAGIEIAAWWLAGALIWTATVSSISGEELAIGFAAAGLCAVLARVARRAIGGQPGLPGRMWLRWLGWAAMVPAVASADLLRLVRWLAAGRREPAREERSVRVPVPSGDGAKAITWRQGAVLAVSSTPGSVVLRVESEDGSLQLDRLVGGRPDLSARVARR
ncbi:hypothetical protein [Microlunatus sp. Gsoil 973]|uniref:hypothetical protein n=1 Tax=Microlunatus sp. Gsoil 973 TaxID=2672569 RepID=UPI0012B491A4|nr:hypothetical protein [Microlunatus sp. Gsoil 973]QGN32863.1 hypothetical protein GJV80_08640 [Microlunatus sp. Gsoil 973]